MNDNQNMILYRALNQAREFNIEFVVWKNRNCINEALLGRFNLDIVLRKSELCKFSSILSKYGFFQARSTAKDAPGVTHFYYTNPEHVFHIHVYTALATGESNLKEFNLPLIDYIISNSVVCPQSGFKIVNDEAACYLYILRHYLKSGSLYGRRAYQKKLLDERQDFGIDDQVLQNINIHYDPLKFLHYTNENEYLRGAMPSYWNSLAVRLYLRQFKRKPAIYFIVKRNYPVVLYVLGLKKILKKSLKRVVPEGKVVAISGSEATGKSTLVKEARFIYERNFNVYYRHVGKPPQPFSRFTGWILSVIRKKSKSKNRSGTSNIRGLNRTAQAPSYPNRILFVIRALEIAVSRYFVAVLAVRRAKNGYIVLTDRWPTLECGKMDGPRINNVSGMLERLSSKIEMWIYKHIPECDQCIVLSVPVEVALQRNHDRLKDGKESSDQIVLRHEENSNFFPKSKNITRFENTRGLNESLSFVFGVINCTLADQNMTSECKVKDRQ